MTGRNTDLPTSTASTRREALNTPTRRLRRALRHRTALIVSGAAVVAVAGGIATVGTQPAIGEALGVPSASATSSPALDGTALDRAQAAATIATARTVVDTANDKTDTATLERRIDALGDYRKLSGGTLTARISSYVFGRSEV